MNDANDSPLAGATDERPDVPIIASAYVAAADQRWCDLDPTNNRAGWDAPGEDYVTLATGRDFGDVSPIRGVIHGGASHALAVGVTVESVSGEPSPPEPRGPARSQQQTQSQNQGQA